MTTFQSLVKGVLLILLALIGFDSTLVSALQVERRDFLSKTVSAATSATVFSNGLLLNPSSSQQQSVAVAAEETIAASTSTTAAPAAAAAAAAYPSPFKLPPMGMGCWAWGDSFFWGYNPKEDQDLHDVFDYAVSKNSPALLDTAELYGFGRSEGLIGDFSKSYDDDKIFVATKFAALPFRTKAESVVKACQASANRLGRGGENKAIDLYQIHFPNAYANEAYWDGLAMAYEKGLVKAVGVSNYGVDATRACHAALAKRGIPLSTNQIQYSLMYRYPEENGLLQACNDLGIQVLSYSPLALGLLSGKYNVETVKDIKGPRKGLLEKTVVKPEFDAAIAAMKEVASGHGEDANVPQVAINWCRAKGTIPIPGARNLRQVKSNYGSLDWNMSPEEVKFLDKAVAGLSYTDPSIAPFPKEDKDTGLKMFDS
jgi:pyridoxine 4-dehydrogenase